MKSAPLSLPVGLALFWALFGGLVLPVPFNPFAPLLAIFFTRFSPSKALWSAALLGLVLSLVGSEGRFGIEALSHALVTLLLYPKKGLIFEEKPAAFALFGALIGGSLTLSELLLRQIFGSPLLLSWNGVVTDCLLMSLADGLYTFLWFTCPLKLYSYGKKVGWKNLFNRRHATP